MHELKHKNLLEKIDFLHTEAVAKHKEGKPEEAISFYLESIKLDENQPAWIYGNVITLLAEVEHFDEGLQLGKEAEKLHPESDEVYRAIGIIYQKQNNLNQALSYFQKAIELNQYQEEWLYTQISEYKSQLRANQVQSVDYNSDNSSFKSHIYSSVKSAIDDQDNTKKINYLHAEAVAKHKEGKLEKAISFYLKSIELDENQPAWIYGNVITLLSEVGRFDEGLELREKAEKLHPESDEVYRAIAIVLNQKGDLIGCINNCQKAIQCNPQQPSWVYSQVTESLIRQNNINKAIEIAEQGIKIYPQFYWLHYHLGEALAAKESWDKAIVAYQRVNKLKPDLPQINQKIDLVNNLKIKSSLDAGVFEKFGKILREEQHWQEAIVFYQRAVKQYPKNADFYYCLGEALVNLHKWEEAITAYRHALQLQPANSSVTSRLEQVTEARKSQLAQIKSHFIYQQDPTSRQEVYRLIKNSALFNKNHYSQNNPDVVQAGLDPLGHYLELGALEGRNPSLFFDSCYYLTQNQDLAELKVNPLAHYLTFGAGEGYNPIPLFDTSYYLKTNPDVKECGLNPLQHYLEFGVAEGRNPHPLFNTSYYLKRNRDVKECNLNPLQHYLEFNTLQAREFNPLFSISNYLEKNPEVQILGLNPLLHYLEKQDTSHRFLYWPWQCLDCTISSQRGHYNLLVFSHDASRTGGPRVLLAFLKELKKSGNLRDINLWIVIDREGEIEAEFQECGLTITLSRLAELSGVDYEQVLRDFLISFQEYTGNGTILVNTSAISHINAVCHELRLPVLSWIHELPVTIDTYCGGRESFQKILDSSRKIVCVSNFVKSSLIKYAQQEAQSNNFTTIYASPPTLENCDRFNTSEAYKREIKAEFSFPDDSFIVMGCGTVTPRKGCDVFVQVANHLINECNIPNIFFLWIGEIFANEYIRWLEHDIQTLGLEGQVIFAGKRSNPSDYMKGSDVFILTSKEDPFPLVNLEAMYYGLPAISFRGGGGAPEIYDEGRRGIAVGYLNIVEMAQAIIKLKENPQLRREIALEAQNYIRQELNWSNFVGNFMELIGSDFDYHPQKELKITVIVPNYNHQKFIGERIASIVNQTVKPDEIIFLDDNSSDQSAEIAVQLLSNTDIPHKIIINEQNTGSPFKQWVKGIKAASGDLIWIAESDDSCKFNLIEKLKPQFFDPNVVLAYSQSAPIGENSQIFQDNYHFYTNDICNERWSTYYKDEGVKEIAQSLCLKNTIPNASAVIFRKEALTDDCLEYIKNFRFVGDWLLYVSLLKEGKVAFVPNSLNCHRRHSGTVTSKVEKEDKHAQEVLELKRHIFSHPFVSANSISESLGRTIDDYYSLDKRHNLGRVAFTKNSSFEGLLSTICSDFNQKYFSSRSSSPGILFLIGDADFGGGQIAAIRLANELAKNYRVFLCNARPGIWNDDLIGLVDSRIVFVEGTLKPTVWSNNKEQRIRVLRDLIQFHHIDVLFSHIWWADRFAYEVNQELNLPWYIQMHGCYEALADHPDWDDDFLKLIKPMMNSASGVGYLTNKNLKVFDKLNLTPPKHMAQFFNGFDRTTVDFSGAESQLIKRGIDDFIFCLCSRAIPEKGWKEAINATIAINKLSPQQRNHKTARLVLIGDSDYAQDLVVNYADNSEITFLGQQKNPTKFYSQCDVGLLPSKFKSESVPCCVIEYLACNLPVIATQIGSVPEMINSNGKEAGLLVPISEDWQFDTEKLKEMMLKYISDKNLFLEHRKNTQTIFEKLFDIKKIGENYISFFDYKNNLITNCQEII